MNKRRKILAAMLAAFMLMVPMFSTAQIDIKGGDEETSDLSGTWGTTQITDYQTGEYVPLGEGLWLLAGAAGLYLLVKSRKTRKATAVAAAALALTLGTTQCKKTEESVIPAGETISISFMAGNGAKADIDVYTGRITWNSGDKVYVVCNNAAPSKDNKAVLLGGYLTAQTENSQQSEISGEVTVPGGYNLPANPSFTFYYVGSGVDFSSVAGSTNLTFDISSQNGIDAGHYMVGRTEAVEMQKDGSKYVPSEDGAKHFDPLTSVLRLDTKAFGAGQMTMDGGNSEMTINLAGDATPSYTAGSITFTSGEDVQISVIPTTTDNANVNATLDFWGNGMDGSIEVKNGIKAGRIYSKVINNAGYPIHVEANGFEVEFIDLGLPSGTLWANANLGAKTLEDPGYYFFWGDPQGYVHNGSKWVKADGVDEVSFNSTAYQSSVGYSVYNNPQSWNPSDNDAAAVSLGNGATLPTHDDIAELTSNTFWVASTDEKCVYFFAPDESHPGGGYAYGFGTLDKENALLVLPYSNVASGNGYGGSPTYAFILEGPDVKYKYVGYSGADEKSYSNALGNGMPVRAVKHVHKSVKIGDLYWATTNIGARTPKDYGWYFTWGGTTGYVHEGSTWVNAITGAADYIFSWDAYNATDASMLSSDIIPTSGYDAARVNWGGNWRMPTAAESQALYNSTYWEWDNTDMGYYVYLPKNENDKGHFNGEHGFTPQGSYSKEEAILFFPGTWYGDGSSTGGTQEDGLYWLSTYWGIGEGNVKHAYYFNFHEASYILPQNNTMVMAGFPIRPVHD